jgi:hypothetical protein
LKKTVFMDKYPVYSLELKKEEVSQKNISEVVEYFKDKVESHKIAKLISVFDNYAHTKELGGEINPEILGAQNVIFCFGPSIPNTKIVAVRPRSIGICELEDSFIIEFTEVPKEQLHDVMESWSKGLKI